MNNTVLSSLFTLSIIFIFSACKKDIQVENNNPSGGTGVIGNFLVLVLNRTQTQDTITWSIPSKPIGTSLKYKVYLSNTLLAQNLTDTNYIITGLIANQAYSGKVVAYTSADSTFTSFHIPIYTGASHPYSYLNGYYKVTEKEYDLNNIGDSNTLIFTGRISAVQDSNLIFYQYTRTPNTWWGLDFGSKVWPSLNDSLYNPNGSSVRGRILNQNSIRLSYGYGNSTTAFSVKQTWEKLQNPADSISYAYQWPSENNSLIKTYAGNDISGSQFVLGDGGPAINASLRTLVTNFYLDAQQNGYISCALNSSIRKVNSNGIISTFAGNHTDGFSGDGGLAINAQLYSPSGVVSDANGNVYISDGGNRRIRKVNSSGIISTYAGTGQPGYFGEGGLASLADIGTASDITTEQTGNLYFITGSRVCKINIVTGILSRVAGTGNLGFSGDGGLATSANLYNPSGITIDLQGNLYIADKGNYVIRKVNAAGIISTIAGTPNQQAAYFNDGILATSAKINVYDIAVDNATGSLYIGSGTGNIYKVDNAGLIYKYAGFASINIYSYCKWSIGPQFYNGDNGPAFNAAFTSSYGLFCKNSVLYSTGQKRIRKIFL